MLRKCLNILFIVSQYLVPQHLLSRLVGRLAECRWPWLKNLLINAFIDRYRVNMQEAADPEPYNYACFNDFFTRALQAGARPIDEANDSIVCPADGAISQIGAIREGRIFQAKGQDYSLTELLGGDSTLAEPFKNGNFATIYLSPRDYHRVHMPLAGTLETMVYVPGDLFSVNGTTAENVPRLFARNERAVCIFSTEVGPMAVILVGAMIVAGIETVWAGQVAPPPRDIQTHHYHNPEQNTPIRLEKGAEMGRFKLGSTAIVLFGEDVVDWLEHFEADSPTLMGETLAVIRAGSDKEAAITSDSQAKP